MRKSCVLILLFLLCSNPRLFGQNDPYLLGSSEHFKFQSNFWMNMHHFLYHKATGAKRGRTITKKEQELIDQLKGEDLAKYQESLKFYKEEIIEKDLLFNEHLTSVKTYLGDFSGTHLPDNADVDPALFAVLNAFSETYRKTFWSLHDSVNRARFQENISTLRKVEPQVIKRLYQLTEATLPDEKTLVDLTAYANWAGAYTSNYPQHIIISSTRTNTPGTTWVELVFHEASHGLVSGRTGLVGSTIRGQSKKLNKEVPRNLWHGVLFYFAGKATAEALEENGISGHEEYMFRNNVFKQYHEVLNLYFPDYLAGKASFEEVIVRVLNHK